MKFKVIDLGTKETIEQIEMDEALLDPEKGIIDPETLSVKGIKHGHRYTIVPLEDPLLVLLNQLHVTHQTITMKGMESFMTAFHRMEDLLHHVGLLFKDSEYVIIKGTDDFKLILEPQTKEFELETVTYNPISDLKNRLGVKDEPEGE